MSILSKLSRSQKEAIGLLQIGTFLEYFDLMLYVHMAVLLNEIFFPQADPHTAALMTAFAFCSTYILRPFGALIFGYIGDHIGRKVTVILTTSLMSVSCIIMANMPTYAQVGITATWLITLCRIIQGLSSMGEIIGAQIYITEITKPPLRYPAVAFIGVASSLGAVAALGVATLVTTAGFNWRVAFWIGAGIAVVGSIARSRLRETPDFIDRKKQVKLELEKLSISEKAQAFAINKLSSDIKINRKTLLSCFFIYCGWPLSFYLVFMYFNPMLKNSFGYTSEDIIYHNLWLSIVVVINSSIYSYLSYRIHPLKIIKRKAQLFLIFTLFLPSMIWYSSNGYVVFLIQSLLLITSIGANPADSVLIKYFPVFKRFTAASFLYAISRAMIYVFTSFSLVYLTEWFDQWGLLLIITPCTLGFLFGVHHFEKLESKDNCLNLNEISNSDNSNWSQKTVKAQ